MTESSESQSSANRILVFGAFVLVVAVLYFGREIIIPLALAGFFAFLLSPVSRRIERPWMPRVAAVILAMAGSLLLVLIVGAVVSYQVAILVDEFPQYRGNILDRVQSAQAFAKGWFGSAAEAVENLEHDLASKPTTTSETVDVAPPSEPVKVKVVAAENRLMQFARAALGVAAHPAITLGIAFVFTFFFLLYREDLRDRILKIMGQARLDVSTRAITDAGLRVSHYLGALAIANLINGAAIGIGLYFLGVPNAFLWGALAAVLRFIPFLGPLLAALFPLAMSIAVSTSWTQPLLVAGWFIVVDQTSANVIEPLLYGARTGVSPTAIIFAFIFWTWLWGAFGLFLAAPLTVMLVALGRHIPAFEMFYVLLGDQPVLQPESRFYQRLLANDVAEARRIVLSDENKIDELATFDAIWAPAVGRIAADFRAGLLPDSRRDEVIKTVNQLFTETTNESDEPEEQPARTDACHVIVWTAGRPLEDAMLPTVRRVLENAGFRVNVCSSTFMMNDVAELAQNEKTQAILLLTTEANRAQRLLLLRRRLDEIKLKPYLTSVVIESPDRRLSIPQRLIDRKRLLIADSLSAALTGIRSACKIAPPSVASSPLLPDDKPPRPVIAGN